MKDRIKRKSTVCDKFKKTLEGWAVVRVSKENFAQNGSPTQQMNLIKDWEKRQSLSTGKNYKVVNYIVEDGKSARYQNTHKRKEILHLAELVKHGTIDFIVTERLDRFSRDEVFNLQIMRDARKNNIELHEVNYGQFNPNDRGQRMGWKFRNLQAGEYSEGVSEDVARKHRSAMIYNGKDPSPHPILGLDLSKKWIGIYEPNKKELEAVKDILESFVRLNYNKKELAKYCDDKGYRTKIWWTKEKNKDGEIIPPKKRGGQKFTCASLNTILESPKLRGYNFFYDNWGQFPDKQDHDGWIKWDYAHFKKHGPIIPESLWTQVDKGLDQIIKRSRSNVFLLSGVLLAEDGSKFTGESAKNGEHLYYYNRHLGKRFPVEHIHKHLFARLKEIITHSSLMKEIIQRIQKHQGQNKFEMERFKIKEEQETLRGVVENFSNALKKLVSERPENLSDILDTMMNEKKTTQERIKELELELKRLSEVELNFHSNMKGCDFKEAVRFLLMNLDKLSPLEQKKLIQTIIPQARIICDEDKNKLELIYNLDAQKKGRSLEEERPLNFTNNDKVVCLKSRKEEKIGSCSVEDKSWPLHRNGGP